MDRNGEEDEEKISSPRSECFMEDPSDFVSKMTLDFDMRKNYEETVLSILNAHSRETIINPAGADLFATKYSKP